MNIFLICFSAGECFLLGFLLLLNPLHHNSKANKWLGLFILIMGTAFIGIYIDKMGLGTPYPSAINDINSLLYLLGPLLYMSVLFFVYPTKVFKPSDWFHFLPFLAFILLENIMGSHRGSLNNRSLFVVHETVFIVRDLLPFQVLIYTIASYVLLRRHKRNLRLISSEIETLDLDWLKYFLIILLIICAFWINDALFEISVLLKLLPFVYAFSIFFLSYFSIKQKTVFAFKKTELESINQIFEEAKANNKSSSKFGLNPNLIQPEAFTNEIDARNEIQTSVGPTGSENFYNTSETDKNAPNLATGKTIRRLSAFQIEQWSHKLNELIYNDKIYLENELNLPELARKLGTSIHNTSYLINEMTGDNFFNFINRHRIEEAKRLIQANQLDKLNILGIAFASGFNSKTAFNTAFKKWTGVPPSTYAKSQKKQ